MNRKSAHDWTATGILAAAVRSILESPLRLMSQLGLVLVCWSVPQQWLQNRIWSDADATSDSLPVQLARLLFRAAWSSPVLFVCLLVALEAVRHARLSKPLLKWVPGRLAAVFIAAVVTELPRESYWVVTTQLPRLGFSGRVPDALLSLGISAIAIFLMARLILAIPLVVDQGASPFRAVLKSWTLTGRALWRVFYLGLFCVVPVMLLSWATRRHDVLGKLLAIPLDTVLLLVWSHLYLACSSESAPADSRA